MPNAESVLQSESSEWEEIEEAMVGEWDVGRLYVGPPRSQFIARRLM